MSRIPTKDDLRQLPLRAILALISRCARRIMPLLGPDDQCEEERNVFDVAVCTAEHYARGNMDVPDVSGEIFNLARVDVNGHHSILAVAALTAQAATQAVGIGIFQGPVITENPFLGTSVESSMAKVMLDSAGEAMLFYSANLPSLDSNPDNDASWIDYQALLAAELGVFPDAGQAVDPSESGLLGSLWPAGQPAWLQCI